MLTATSVTDPRFDQRVRGHDFLAYFKSHMIAICLLFWFFTISVSVTASAIYLLKKMEAANRVTTPATTSKGTGTGPSGQRGTDENEDSVYHHAYANYDVLGFLIDALYAGDAEESANRSKEASKSTHISTQTVATGLIYEEPATNEGKTEISEYDEYKR